MTEQDGGPFVAGQAEGDAARTGPPTPERIVTVAVVTHNSAADLPAFFAAVRHTAADVRLRVVVADNASTDSTTEIVSTVWPGARVIRLPTNAGYAAGVNAALDAWPGDGPVLVLNPHVRMHNSCLPRLLAAMNSNPADGICVPRLVDEQGANRLSLRRTPTVGRAWGEALLGGRRARRFAALSEVIADPAAYGHSHRVDWATGAAMLLSEDCMKAVPTWSTAYFMYSEETDYALRCRDAGFHVRFVHDAVAYHRDAGSTEAPDLWSRQVLSRVALFRGRHDRSATAAFVAAVLANEVLRIGRGSKHRAAAVTLVSPQTRRQLQSRLMGRAGTGDVTATAREAPPDREPGLVCFSAQDWWYHNRAHSDFQLMRRVAASREVLFVNSIGMRMPLPGRSTQPWRRVARKAASMARFVRTPLPERPSFHVLTPVVLPFYGSPTARQLNTLMVAWQVRLVAHRLGIHRPSCVVTIPTAWPVARRLDVRGIAYNRSDKHSEFAETDQTYIRDLESQLLQGADRIFYVSRALMAAEHDQTGDRGHFLDHGVDLDMFHPTDRDDPALAKIPAPRIGFFGGFDDYVVDMELLEKVAMAIPGASLVLIGDATCDMDRLTRHPNVHWLGFRPHEDIPRLGSSFDVALMPWLCNAWIEACNPIKLKEYLALGLPVVSTDFPEVHHYRSVVRIAADQESFVDLVRMTLEDGGPGTPAVRRTAVAGASWDERAEELLAICDGMGDRA